MVFQTQQAVRAAILLFFTVLIFKFHYTGEITKFINPKYIGLSQIASVLFLILFFIQITRIWEKKTHHHHHDHECSHNHDCDHNHDHGNTPMTLKKVISYVIIAFPLVTGFTIPAKVLDSSIAEKKGGMAVITGKSEKPSPSTDESANEEVAQPSDTEVLPNPYGEITQEEMNSLVQKLKQSDPIDMDDYVYYLNYEEISKDVASFKGKEITLKGFVYKEDGFQSDQLVISRFLITHCVADASIIGFLTQFEEAATLEKDTWVEATGILDVTTYNGTEMPFIKITDWKTIEQPSEPYLFPLNVRIL